MRPGSAFRLARVALGRSQAELAAALGVAQSTVCRWDRGRCVPAPERRADVAAAVGRTLAELGWITAGESPAGRGGRNPRRRAPRKARARGRA